MTKDNGQSNSQLQLHFISFQCIGLQFFALHYITLDNTLYHQLAWGADVSRSEGKAYLAFELMNSCMDVLDACLVVFTLRCKLLLSHIQSIFDTLNRLCKCIDFLTSAIMI